MSKQYSIPLFTTSLFAVELEDKSICDNILNSLYKLKEQDNREECLSWASKDDLYEYEDFQDIKNIMHLHFNRILKEEYKYIFEDTYINNMWGNITYPQSIHDIHTHANSFFSALLYLTDSFDNGQDLTYFENKATNYNQIELDTEEWSTLNSSRMFIKPVKGTILFFPSSLPHGVYGNPNEIPLNNVDKRQRATLAATAMVKAKTTTRTSKVKYT